MTTTMRRIMMVMVTVMVMVSQEGSLQPSEAELARVAGEQR